MYEYSLDTGDLSIATTVFDDLVQHYSLSQFINSTDGLVHKLPLQGLPPGMPTQAANTAAYYDKVYQDLIDWPDGTDSLSPKGFPEGAKCCRDQYQMSNVSTVINAHTAHAHRRLAQMARWLGRPAAEAQHYDALADSIRFTEDT